MLQKKQSSVVEDKLEVKRKQIIKELSEKYDYNETIEDGRIVLTHKRLRFVEIKDTNEDREKYKFVLDNYFQYIKDNYVKNATRINVDADKAFNQEVLQSNKLPLFFVYNMNNVLLGTCGFRHSMELDANGCKTIFNEISVRINDCINKKKRCFGYGAISFLIIYLYAMKQNERIYLKSFSNIRDVLFRGINSFVYFNYIGCSSAKFLVIDNDVLLDFFVDDKNNIKNLDKLMSCDV